MRLPLTVLTLLLSLSACAVQPGPAGGPGRGYRPLQAVLSPPDIDGIGGLGFYVDRPAHVALFEIVPGQGASLVYPTPGSGRADGLVYSGTHRISTIRRYNAAQYLPATRALVAGGPRFYFLLASERPLDLAQFGGYAMGLRSAMGLQFASFNGYSSMETLARLVLPSTADDGSWTSDLYVHWPRVLYDSPSRRPGLVQVRCNGYSAFVPLAQLGAVRETLCAPQPGTPQPGDSASHPAPGGVKPQPRSPLPRAEAERLRERIGSSSQLDEQGARRPAPRTPSGARSGAEGRPSTRGTDDARVRSRPGVTNAPASRGTTGGARTPSAGSSEPRSRRPAAAPREPASRPSGRQGDSPRAAPRGSDCNPCQQR